MVRHPAVFLMDEPLSNLDAKLRVQMRAEITALHRRLGSTFVFVTHDQAEAMTMSDRVAVMMSGELIQIGAPEELYADPQDLRVAEFIGSPKINVMPAAALDPGTRAAMAAAPRTNALAFRPEAADICAPTTGVLVGSIEGVENLGSDIFLHVAVKPTHSQGTLPLIVRVAPSGRRFTVGETVGIDPDPTRVLQFDVNGHRLKARERVAA